MTGLRPRPAPFGTQPTGLHGGRIVFVLTALLLLAFGAWVWLFHKGAGGGKDVTESGTNPGWTAAQLHYDKPELKAEPLLPKPIDRTAELIAQMLARLTSIESRLTALENRKPPAATTIVKEAPKPEPPKKVAGPMLFVAHEAKEAGGGKAKEGEYTLAPGSYLPLILQTAINSDVEGYFVSVVSTNVYDTASGKHLLVPQGSKVVGHDQSQALIFGNERLPTVSLTLTLPDGRSVDLGHAPVTDAEGVAGLTGLVNNHIWRLVGAVFIGGVLRGGTQALQVAAANAAGAGQVASGIGSVGSQALSPRIGRAIDTRPTILVAAGQLGNVLLTRPLVLPAMWQ
jgi:hypothetical protein